MIIWTGTIGHTDIDRESLPPGSAQPMSEAIEKAFEELTGFEPNITFSGWGQDFLPEAHMAVVEKRNVLDDDEHYAAWTLAQNILEDLVLEEPLDVDDGRQQQAMAALCELIWFRNKQAVSS